MRETVLTAIRYAAVILAALLVGCASLPDVAPYRDATVQLRTAVVASGSVVATELAGSALAVEGRDRSALEESARAFAESWKARVESADALVSYVQALAQLAGAGKTGGEAARSLAAALAQLAGGVGIALPAAGAAAAATDTAALVYAHVAAVRASSSLEEALVAAQPAINEIAVKLGKDLDASLALVRAAYGLQRGVLAARYNDETAYLESLRAERRKLYARGSLRREDERRLKEIEEMYEATWSWREPMQSAFDELDRRYKAEREVIAATRAAVFEWAAAHRELAVAVQDGRSINVEGLLQATLEARELVRRLRAL
jgi:hypothetical protein